MTCTAKVAKFLLYGLFSKYRTHHVIEGQNTTVIKIKPYGEDDWL